MMLAPRVMTNEDIERVHSVECAANQFPWTKKNFMDSVNAGHHAWVYSDQYDDIIGYAIVQLIVDEAHLLNICVDPHLQGRGFGRRILEHIIDHAKSRSAVSIILEVRRSNYRAQQLYLQSGFNEMSIRHGYYPAEKGREDAIIMGLDLDIYAIFN